MKLPTAPKSSIAPRLNRCNPRLGLGRFLFSASVAAPFILSVGIVALLDGQSAEGATITKANTTTLNAGADWTGGTAPTAADIALFDATISAPNIGALSLGANLAWQGLSIGTTNGPAVITNAGGFTLTLGTSGINMSAATNNLAINSNLTLVGAQAWSAATGRTLDVSGGTFTRTGSTVDFTNFNSGATLSGITNDASGILGSWATTGSGTTLNYVKNTAGSVTAFTTQTAGTAGTLANVTSATTNYSFGAAATTTANLTGNTLRYTSGNATLAIGAANTLTLNGLMNAGSGSTLTISGGAGSGGLLIGSTNELVITGNTQATTISSVIAGAGGAVTYSGLGNLTLSGANTFGTAGSRGFTLNSGTLTVGVSAVVTGGVITSGVVGKGTLTLSGGTLTHNAVNQVVANDIVVTAGTTTAVAINGSNFNFGDATLTTAQAVTGSGTLTFGNAGANASTVFQGTNFSGFTGTLTQATTTANANNVIFQSSANLSGATVNITSVNNNNNSSFNAGGTGITVQIGALTGTGGFLNSNNATNLIQIGALGTITTFAGGINNGSAATNIEKLGVGTLTLSGTGATANTYTGSTTVSNGTLDITGTSSGNGTLTTSGTGVLQVGGGSGTATFGNLINGVSAGVVLGDAAGVGTLTLSGTVTGAGTIVGGNSANSTLILTGTMTNTTVIGGAGANQNNINLVKTGANTSTLQGANTYSGTTTIGTAGSTSSGGTLTVSGASGAIATSSGYTISGSGSQLNIDYTGVAGLGDRLNDSSGAAVTLNNGGDLRFTQGTNAATTSETFGTLILGQGYGLVTLNQGGIGGAVHTSTAAGFARGSNFATALLRGTNLGAQNNTNRAELKLTSTTGLTQVGTATSATGLDSGSVTNLTIVPYLTGNTSASATGGSTFVTYDSTSGFRSLGTNEQATITSALAAAGDVNVKLNGATVTLTSGAKTYNSFGGNVGGGSSNATLTGAGGGSDSLTLTSGALANFGTTANGDLTISGFSKIIFGGTSANSVTVNEAVITTANTSAGLETFIRSGIDMASAGGGLTKAGVGILYLEAANFYTGVTTINQGTLQIGSVSAGRASGSLAGSGSTGAVTITSGATLNLDQTTAATFANDVANAGTFNITNNGTMTLSGNITGAGGGTFSTIAASKTLILSGTANTYSNGTTISGSGTLQFNAGSTSGVSGASSANSAITMASGATLQLRGDNNATFNTGTITMPSDTSSGSDTTSFNFDVGPASTGSNKTLTLGTLTFNTGTSGNRGNDVATINLTGTTGYTLAITNALGASSNGQVGQNYQYNVASGLTLSLLGGLQSGIGGSHIFQGAGNTIVGTLDRAANRAFNVFNNGTGTVTFNNAVTNGGGSGNYGTGFNSGTTVFNNVSAVNGQQINLGNQTAASTADANFLLGGSTGLNGGLSFGSTVRPYDTTSGLLTIGGQNTSGTNTFSAGIQLGNTTNTGKSVNLVAAAGGEVDFTGAIVKNGTDTTAGITINGAYTVNGATVNPTGSVKLAGANTYGGVTTLAGGTLISAPTVTGNSVLGSSSALTFTGGTLQYGNAFSVAAGNALGDYSAKIVNSTSAISIDTLSQNVTYASALDNTNTGGLTKLNSGTLALTAANLYTGTTTVTGGTLKTTGSGTLGNVNNGLTVNTGGTLDLAATSQGVGALNGTGGTILNSTNTTASTLTVGNNNGTGGSYAGVIADNVGGGATGTVALTKVGTGTQTLAGANTYTGPTNVTGGTLLISGSINATSGVSVTGGKLQLSGNSGEAVSKLGTATTVALTNSALDLSTYSSTTGAPLAVGALSLSGTSSIDFGSLGNTFKFANSNSPTTWFGATLSIYDWSPGVDHLFFGTDNNGLTTTQLGQITFYGGDAMSSPLGTAAFIGGGELAAVPEPSTLALVVGALGLIGFRERRRLRKIACR